MTESVDPGPGVLTRQPGPTHVSGLSGRLGVPLHNMFQTTAPGFNVPSPEKLRDNIIANLFHETKTAVQAKLDRCNAIYISMDICSSLYGTTSSIYLFTGKYNFIIFLGQWMVTQEYHAMA